MKRRFDTHFKTNADARGLQPDHPAGFVVRLHVLGDFYDDAYVMLWRRWMAAFPALRIFGYTARPADSILGRFINTLNADFGDRAYIRFSRVTPSEHVISAITIPDAHHPTDAIICPAQTGRTSCCGTCGLCWSTDRTIAFLQHGGFSGGRPRHVVAEDGYTADDIPPPAAPPPPAASAAPIPAAEVVPATLPRSLRMGPLSRPPAPAAAITYDPAQLVPLRTIEIRAWLGGIIGKEADMPADTALLVIANLHRDRLQLPRFRLIRERGDRSRQENIMATA